MKFSFQVLQYVLMMKISMVDGWKQCWGLGVMRDQIEEIKFLSAKTKENMNHEQQVSDGLLGCKNGKRL